MKTRGGFESAAAGQYVARSGYTAQANTIELDAVRAQIRARAEFTTTANTPDDSDFHCLDRLISPSLIDIEGIKAKIQKSGDCKNKKRFEVENTAVLVCINGKAPSLDCATIAGMVDEIAQQCKHTLLGVDVADGTKYFTGTHSYVKVTVKDRAKCRN